MTDLEKILPHVIDISKKAGSFIRRERETFSRSRIEEKGVNNLVSYVDKEAEKMLVEGLEQLLPEAGFITEEGTISKKGEVYNWIIDPLDGTTNFLHNLPIYSVSIALMRNDEVVLGVVYEIGRDECFYALEGGKAYCNDKEIKVSEVPKLKEGLLATGFPYYSFDKIGAYLDIMSEFMQNTHGLRRMGSAAVDLAYVACGRFEGYYEFNIYAWDVAAGALIVERAGGKVTDFTGGKNFIFGKQIIAANAVHAEILEVISKRWN